MRVVNLNEVNLIMSGLMVGLQRKISSACTIGSMKCFVWTFVSFILMAGSSCLGCFLSGDDRRGLTSCQIALLLFRGGLSSTEIMSSSLSVSLSLLSLGSLSSLRSFKACSAEDDVSSSSSLVRVCPLYWTFPSVFSINDGVGFRSFRDIRELVTSGTVPLITELLLDLLFMMPFWAS